MYKINLPHIVDITIFFKYILNSLIFGSTYLLDINNQAKLIDM